MYSCTYRGVTLIKKTCQCNAGGGGGGGVTLIKRRVTVHGMSAAC